MDWSSKHSAFQEISADASVRGTSRFAPTQPNRRRSSIDNQDTNLDSLLLLFLDDDSEDDEQDENNHDDENHPNKTTVDNNVETQAVTSCSSSSRVVAQCCYTNGTTSSRGTERVLKKEWNKEDVDNDSLLGRR
jgi:hypothetical protein